jgi:hypothetical protein
MITVAATAATIESLLGISLSPGFECPPPGAIQSARD